MLRTVMLTYNFNPVLITMQARQRGFILAGIHLFMKILNSCKMFDKLSEPPLQEENTRQTNENLDYKLRH